MTNQKITVLGAGASGMTTAAYLTQCGCQVTLCDSEEQAADFSAIRERGGILLQGGTGKNGLAMPWRLTNSFQEALEGAERILVCVSASRSAEIAERCAPLAQPGQTFLFSPGTFESFALRAALDALGKERVYTAELCGNFWACRRTAPAVVTAALPLKDGIRVAALPARDTAHVIEVFAEIFSLCAGRNVLEVALNSPNVISHVSGAVLNATQIERRGEDFAFFLDGLGETVIDCFEQLENERDAVLARVGLLSYGPHSAPMMHKIMEYDQFSALDYFRKLDGPSSFRHRYVTEDAACGVAMLVSLGKAYGIPTPLTESFAIIAGAINGVDYLRSGCTLKNLGLAGLSADELLERL